MGLRDPARHRRVLPLPAPRLPDGVPQHGGCQRQERRRPLQVPRLRGEVPPLEAPARLRQGQQGLDRAECAQRQQVHLHSR
eukprot:13442397-Alexandrium_andersonii.AAC.1